MSKPHPLDIFRSSEQGFDAASRLPRKRRTVTGKIVRSQARPAPAAAALSKAGKGDKAGRRKAGRASRAGRPSRVGPMATAKGRLNSSPRVSNRVLLYTALALITTVTGWVVIPQWFDGGDAATGVVPLRREAIFKTARDEGAAAKPAATTAAKPPSGPDRDQDAGMEPSVPMAKSPAPSAAVHFTVLVVTYGGSQLSIAQETARELKARGFDGVTLLGYDAEGSGYARVELVVGQASSRTELDRLRDDLRSIDDWGSGRESKPFHDARVIEHPNPNPGSDAG